MAKKSPSLKTKGRVKTNSQKKQTIMQRNSRSNAIHKIADHTSKGTGKFAKRSNAPLSSKQAYKLEKMSLRNERAGLETKPELIKAAGQALSMNITPATSSYAASAGASKVIDSANKNNNSVNQLINGGANQADRDNDEEMVDDTLPGGANIR